MVQLSLAHQRYGWVVAPESRIFFCSASKMRVESEIDGLRRNVKATSRDMREEEILCFYF